MANLDEILIQSSGRVQTMMVANNPRQGFITAYSNDSLDITSPPTGIIPFGVAGNRLVGKTNVLVNSNTFPVGTSPAGNVFETRPLQPFDIQQPLLCTLTVGKVFRGINSIDSPLRSGYYAFFKFENGLRFSIDIKPLGDVYVGVGGNGEGYLFAFGDVETPPR